MIVDSVGGGHGYWLLAEPFDVQAPGGRARLEACNRALARAVAGPERQPDHVQDVARVLRLPGSRNFKYTPARPVSIRRFEPARRYDLGEIEAIMRTQYPWALATPGHSANSANRVTSAPPTPIGLRERAEQGRVRRTTLALLDSTGDGGYQSASEADAAIAAGLIGAGLTTDEAYSLLLHSTRGRDALERKGRYGEVYLQRTVEHAAGYVGPVIERPEGLRLRRTGTGLPSDAL